MAYSEIINKEQPSIYIL